MVRAGALGAVARDSMRAHRLRAQRLPRAHRCNDKLHNIDVRLSIGNKGLVQLHDAVKGWVYVHTDDANMAATASSACRAMGYERHVGVHIDPLIHASKRLNCPRPDTRISVRARRARSAPPRSNPCVSLCTQHARRCTARAASQHPHQECAVEELPTLRTGALYADCGSGGYRAELCVRVGQRSRTSNNLRCAPSDATGVGVPGHARRPGAAHVVCGTAGINESRIEWYDGFQDDFAAYTTTRTADGRVVSAQLVKDGMFGQDLLTQPELDIDERKRDLVLWQALHRTDFESFFKARFSETDVNRQTR